MKYTLKELSDKYYDKLDSMMNDFAEKCTGGEEVTLSFASGKVTIRLK